MGVDLGGFDVGMPHQFLHHPDVDEPAKSQPPNGFRKSAKL
jgi:hypothetical protein